MAKKKTKVEKGKAKNKIATVMREFREKKLNIGKSKKKVKKRSQAIAIALDSARREGEGMPKKPIIKKIKKGK